MCRNGAMRWLTWSQQEQQIVLIMALFIRFSFTVLRCVGVGNPGFLAHHIVTENVWIANGSAPLKLLQYTSI